MVTKIKIITGTKTLRIDSKGRLVVPKNVRNVFPKESEFYIRLLTQDKSPFSIPTFLVHPKIAYEAVSADYMKRPFLDPVRAEFFGGVEGVVMDNTNRILIPRFFLETAFPNYLGKPIDAKVSGNGDSFYVVPLIKLS